MLPFTLNTSQSLRSIATIKPGEKYSVDEVNRVLTPYKVTYGLGWMYPDPITTVVPALQKLADQALREINNAQNILSTSKGMPKYVSAIENESIQIEKIFKEATEGLRRLQTTYGGLTTEQGTSIQNSLISYFEDIQRNQLAALVKSANHTVAFQNRIDSPGDYGFSQQDIDLLSLASKACEENKPTTVRKAFILLPTPHNDWVAVNKGIELKREMYSVKYPAIRLSDQKMLVCEVSQIRTGSDDNEAAIKGVTDNVIGEMAGIVRLYAKITDGKTHYSVMDLYNLGSLEQQNLSTWDSERKLSCMRQLILALNNLYKQKITHPEIKPANIFLRNDSSAIQFALVDPGAIMFQNAPEVTDIATTLFMSPERLDTFMDQNASLPPGSDVWALGCVFWKMLKAQDPPWMETLLQSSKPIDAGKTATRVRLPEPEKPTPLHLVWEMLDPDPKTRIKPDQLAERFTELVRSTPK